MAGPNGAGKSTAGPALVRDLLGVNEFVDADVIARGLSGFEPERAAIAAGRIMLRRVKELARQRARFAFETTLASRTFAPWLTDLIPKGYEFHVIFLWLTSPDLAVARVADRVRLGGHGVPEKVIRRRYARGLRNFLFLYRPLASTWSIYDNSPGTTPAIIASGRRGGDARVLNETIWKRINEEHGQ